MHVSSDLFINLYPSPRRGHGPQPGPYRLTAGARQALSVRRRLHALHALAGSDTLAEPEAHLLAL